MMRLILTVLVICISISVSSAQCITIPPHPNLPPLPRDEDIQNLMRAGSEQMAYDMWNKKFNALQPQRMTTSDGKTFIGNPYYGWQSVECAMRTTPR